MLERDRRAAPLAAACPRSCAPALEPGALADAVAAWAEPRRRRAGPSVLAAVDVGERVELVARLGARPPRRAAGRRSRSATTSPRASTSSSASTCCASSSTAIRKELGEGDDDVVGEYRTKLDDARRCPTASRHVHRQGDRPARAHQRAVARARLDPHLARPRLRAAVGSSAATTRSTSPPPATCSTPTTTASPTSRTASSSSSPSASCATTATSTTARRRAAPPSRGAGAIITLVGPPGVGKTSLGESIARAMGRKFVRVALGGVRDEAEIRGHRRTYVGSQPGRIVRAITEAGTMNPVILLDEVDKLGAGGWSGDPDRGAARGARPGAEPHVPRPLPRARPRPVARSCSSPPPTSLDTIPAPLLDRMDFVRLDGYTDDEKVFIADRYLLPRQLRAGRPARRRGRPSTTTPSLAVIRGYTREAGVRSLERELGRLARKVAAKIAAGADDADRVDAGDLQGLARPAQGRRRGARAHRAARRGHRPRRHRRRRRRAVHRDDGVPHGRRQPSPG